MRLQTSLKQRGAGPVARGLAAALVIVCCVSAFPSAQAAGQPQGQRPQDEFVPVRDLPQQDQLPAAPLLVAAYIVVWLTLLVYLWTIWRRLGKVDQELAALTRRLSEQGSQARR
jgi:CcmD family protein